MGSLGRSPQLGVLPVILGAEKLTFENESTSLYREHQAHIS